MAIIHGIDIAIIQFSIEKHTQPSSTKNTKTHFKKKQRCYTKLEIYYSVTSITNKLNENMTNRINHNPINLKG